MGYGGPSILNTAELLIDVFCMAFYGQRGYKKSGRDLFIAEALGQQLQYLKLGVGISNTVAIHEIGHALGMFHEHAQKPLALELRDALDARREGSVDEENATPRLRMGAHDRV